MLPYLIDGLFAGAIYALASLGIVLTYKTTGIFNFAFGGVAMFCAFIFWQLRDQWGLSQWFSIPILVLVVAPIVGLVLQGLFSLLSTAPTEVVLVVALAALSFFQYLVPLVFPGGSILHQLPSIFGPGKFKLAGTYVTANELGTFILALALGAGLFLLIRKTSLGVSTRAVVDNRDLAGMIGVNANAVGQAAWVISAVFGAIAGVVLSTENGLNTFILPGLVIYCFAPAVLGRLVSLPWAFFGAFVLGVGQDLLGKFNSSGFVSNLESAIPDIALFVLLIVLTPWLSEVKAQVRPLVVRRPPGNDRRWLITGLAGGVLAAAIGPQIFHGATLTDLAEAMAYSLVALTLVVLTGWTGQISIAQMSFAGIGAFTAGHIAGTDGAMFPLAVLVGALIAAAVGIILGLPALRLAGVFLAILTLAFAEVMDKLVFANNSITGGLTGLNLTAAKIGPLSLKSPESRFYLCLIVLAVAATGAFWLRRGPVGRRLQMVRDSPDAASTSGANISLTKLAVFAGGAAVASIGGALLAVNQQTIDPNNFAFSTSLELLLLVILGGRLLVSGSFYAGALYLLTLLSLPTWFDKYFGLSVAIAVIFIAREPDGTFVYAARQTAYCLAPLYRRPRPAWLLAGSEAPVSIEGATLRASGATLDSQELVPAALQRGRAGATWQHPRGTTRD